MTWLLPSWRWC